MQELIANIVEYSMTIIVITVMVTITFIYFLVTTITIRYYNHTYPSKGQIKQ